MTHSKGSPGTEEESDRRQQVSRVGIGPLAPWSTHCKPSDFLSWNLVKFSGTRAGAERVSEENVRRNFLLL
jgi:hypothetical protein